MFTVEIGTSSHAGWYPSIQVITGDTSQGALWYNITIFAILLLTVLVCQFCRSTC